MTKTQSIKLFGSIKNLAAALDIKRQAIYQWPEELSQRQSDRISGVAMRMGLTEVKVKHE